MRGLLTTSVTCVLLASSADAQIPDAIGMIVHDIGGQPVLLPLETDELVEGSLVRPEGVADFRIATAGTKTARLRITLYDPDGNVGGEWVLGGTWTYDGVGQPPIYRRRIQSAYWQSGVPATLYQAGEWTVRWRAEQWFLPGWTLCTPAPGEDVDYQHTFTVAPASE